MSISLKGRVAPGAPGRGADDTEGATCYTPRQDDSLKQEENNVQVNAIRRPAVCDPIEVAEGREDHAALATPGPPSGLHGYPGGSELTLQEAMRGPNRMTAYLRGGAWQRSGEARRAELGAVSPACVPTMSDALEVRDLLRGGSEASLLRLLTYGSEAADAGWRQLAVAPPHQATLVHELAMTLELCKGLRQQLLACRGAARDGLIAEARDTFMALCDPVFDLQQRLQEVGGEPVFDWICAASLRDLN
ncbi:MAG: hypothetical protein EOO40_08835, partial [Deltaproteobacteria bacterium]